VEAEMPLFTMLPPGTAVVATGDFDPIIRGQCGIVTDCTPGSWRPLRRTHYACTFLGGISVTVTRSQIMRHEHGFSREMLADPLWFFHTRDLPTATRKVPAARRPDAADAA
jgi:hypothetical protein